ncbi:PD-(D/E)XK nuclease family protein [Olsenella sp. HMSC062G07]|uniref:PD-(D/E)XK nuclease family protein n=1 Tax=Olsenella sp. HMSC062G07 TaxID=1739330 RepID=UPI0008A42C26|nr:PD-(D/E)XK nuclease family protein [Olsenella sp. HMSC062G07]OFK24162.1 hypothetical protein HMPREF2826_08550 [Olsenella sp. HMSC062G07]
MSLTIVWTREETVVCSCAREVLGEALHAGGRAVLLVPNFQRQVDASTSLAEGGLSPLGLMVSTPAAWARERWEVWGDGTRVIDSTTRTAAMQRTLAQAGPDRLGGMGANAGTVDVLCSLASRALPWLSSKNDGLAPARDGLTGAEGAALLLVEDYARMIHAHGFVEGCEAMARLADVLQEQGVTPVPVVFDGFRTLPRTLRELALGLAAHGNVTVVARCPNRVAAEGFGENLDLLCRAARERGIVLREPRREDVSACAQPGRSHELGALLSTLYGARERLVSATGAVSLLQPAGPLAEGESVARCVRSLADRGCRSVVVAAADGSRAWRELAPKLVARGVGVRAQLAERVLSTEAGRAFLEFAESVALLSELAQRWPDSQGMEGETLVGLGDMSWWPPRALCDFLRSEISHVPVPKALSLDRAWRADRLLTPRDVLDTLLSPRRTSPEIAAATRELLRGRLASAAARLLAPYAAGQVADELADYVVDDAGEMRQVHTAGADALAESLASGALAAVIEVARALRSLGVTADPEARGGVSLARLVSLARDALGEASVVARPRIEVAGAGAQVTILSGHLASFLAPGSVDAAVLCSQTSEEAPVGNGDDVVTAILDRLGVEPKADPMLAARADFAALVALPSRFLVAQRCSFDPQGKNRYPSVMLSELLACYGVDSMRDPRDVGLAVEELGDGAADANAAPSGEPSVPRGEERPSPAGRIGAANRALVVVPPEGRDDLLDGRPLLSASQIESYLECPYKWFSLRRLRLQDFDAGFSPMETGTFAHRVMELTHRELLCRALEASDALGEGFDPEDAPTVGIAGSRLLEGDGATRELVRQILLHTFDEELRRQLIREGKHSRYQAFVPHTAADRDLLRTLREDLLSALDFEAGLFLGYEPRYFEWNFGRKDDLVEYAGAYLTGTIDRVDVDRHGQAVVIDYKHKSPKGFAQEHNVLQPDDSSFSLPRRVQSLIYAQVVRRRRPDLRVTAAVYLGTKGDHAIAGAVGANALENVLGSRAPRREKAARALTVDDSATYGMEGESGMGAFLDATERAIREKVGELLDGNIEAHPKDERACSYCPVMNCDRRISQ